MEQFADVPVSRLGEILVPQADRIERVGHLQANHFIGQLAQVVAGFMRTNRHRDDDTSRLPAGARRQ